MLSRPRTTSLRVAWLAGVVLIAGATSGARAADPSLEPPPLGGAPPADTGRVVAANTTKDAPAETPATTSNKGAAEAAPAAAKGLANSAPASPAPATKARTVPRDPSQQADDDTAAAASKAAPAPAPEKATRESAARRGPAPGRSPASPPPLNTDGLKEELRRGAGTRPTPIDGGAPPRAKLEQMLAEVSRARTALREDTARLEALMAEGNEPSGGGAAGGGSAGAGSGAPKPAAKHPLDVLAKALRGIKPAQAAPIVERLDRRLAANVLHRMPPPDAGKILGACKPDVGAELATHMAARPVTAQVRQ